MLCWMSRFIYCYADCHYAECCYAVLHFCNGFYKGRMFYRWCPQNNLKFDAMQLFFTTFNELLHPSNPSSGQFHKHFTSVGYESWFVATSTYFAVVVNYDSKLLKKLVLVSSGPMLKIFKLWFPPPCNKLECASPARLTVIKLFTAVI